MFYTWRAVCIQRSWRPEPRFMPFSPRSCQNMSLFVTLKTVQTIPKDNHVAFLWMQKVCIFIELCKYISSRRDCSTGDTQGYSEPKKLLSSGYQMLTDKATASLCESEFSYFLISMLHKRLTLSILNLMNMKRVHTYGYYRGCLHLQKHDLMLLYVQGSS